VWLQGKSDCCVKLLGLQQRTDREEEGVNKNKSKAQKKGADKKKATRAIISDKNSRRKQWRISRQIAGGNGMADEMRGSTWCGLNEAFDLAVALTGD